MSKSLNVLRLMEQFGLRHRLVLASVKEEDFGKNYCDNNFFATILAAVKKKDFRTFFGKEYCQRPIVIGFFHTSSLVKNYSLCHEKWNL